MILFIKLFLDAPDELVGVVFAGLFLLSIAIFNKYKHYKLSRKNRKIQNQLKKY